MAQVQIINGIYTDSGPDFRASYPVNLIPVPKNSGVSAGYLRPGYGLAQNGSGPGVSRGGIEWNGICYRVMGTQLVTIAADGTVTILGDVGGSDQDLVTFDYSFDLLAIASGESLYYWNPSTLTLTRVSDPDIGKVLDVCWIDGYFMTTDGEFLVVTELSDPTQVNPLKYGSSEVDPDPVVRVIRLRNEVYAVNRYTIEVFDNVGGNLFPFQRIDGAQIQKGAVGSRACCVFMDTIAFIGGGRNEPAAVYMSANANASKISTDDIDKLLRTYTSEQLKTVKLEAVSYDAHRFLMVHLPDRTIAFDFAATQIVGEPVWFTLTSTMNGFSRYLARDFVWCYGKWLVGNPESSAIGYLDETVSSHWGQHVRWEFGTIVVYNESRGAIFHELELVALTGRVSLGSTPRINTSHSADGETWSQDRWILAGDIGSRLKRLRWMRNGIMRSSRIQRFRGDSLAHVSFTRLEIQFEPLAV